MSFTIRTTLPNKGDKLYNKVETGGYSHCIYGKPTQEGLNVLDNCVGWACSRFNEIYNELTGYVGMKYYQLNCDAEKFVERGKKIGLEVSNEPVAGGIMVWQGKGDLAGHVENVETINKLDSNGKPVEIMTSSSGYNHYAFANKIRKKTNGKWDISEKYPFLGCIVNPAVTKETTYTVEGDTLSYIADKFGVTEQSIIDANGIVDNKIYVGQELVIPDPVRYEIINAKSGVWCRLDGYGLDKKKYKVIPYKTKCVLLEKDVGKKDGYNWDKIIYDGKIVYLPNKWSLYE